MPETREQQIRINLSRLAAVHAAAMSALEESIAILQAEIESQPVTSSIAAHDTDKVVDPNSPFIDRSLMCVVFRGARCFLGNTLMLKLLERLLRRPNQYISHDILLRDVWNAVRDPSSIRSVVRELRTKLRAAGMSGLAIAIDGHVAGHYGLMLEAKK